MMRPAQVCRVVVGMMLCFVAAADARAADANSAKPRLANPLFVFDNGTGRDQHVPLAEQAQLLKDLGYAGIGFSGTQRTAEMLAELDARGLKMFTIYVNTSVDPTKPPYDPGLKTAIGQLKGRDTLISLFLNGGTPSGTDADDRAVAMIREIADMAEKSGLRVALYPHWGEYIVRVEDAIRLVKKANRKNVGVTFNLCHFLKSDDEKNLEQKLKEARPYLFAVSVSGADSGQTNAMDWDRLIQTLDRGTFDVGRVLKTLKKLNYTGPIGLQCYQIPGDRRENLARSMAAWRKLAGQ